VSRFPEGGPTASFPPDLYVSHIGIAERKDAEDRLKLIPHKNPGDYIIRISSSAPTTPRFGANFGICIWFNNEPNHYPIEKFETSVGPGRFKFGIGKGVRYEFLAQLIKHYEHSGDGLCCKFAENINKGTEIPMSELTIERTLLGEGEFGEVRKATWRNPRNGTETYVAIKSLKGTANAGELAKFKAEGIRMIRLQHKNVVKLEGYVTDKNMLVTEFVRLGGLREYIRKRHKTPEPVGLDMLQLYIGQVAEGMAYLAAMQIIHRDLAARNILIDSEREVKISDFGMSRETDYYTSSREGVWPLKWYAPESVFKSKFTSKSDVWSFGVCAWEILSHGKKPYKEFRTGNDVVKFALEGRGRLAIPDGCPTELYKVLLLCWQHLPADRPDFEQVTQLLATCGDDRYEDPAALLPGARGGGSGGGGAATAASGAPPIVPRSSKPSGK
jgi:hypothetical protein